MTLKIEASKQAAAWPTDIRYPIIVVDRYDMENMYLVSKNDAGKNYFWVDLSTDGYSFHFDSENAPNAEGWEIFNGSILLSNQS